MQVTSASPSAAFTHENEAVLQAASRRERGRWLRQLWAGRIITGLLLAFTWQIMGRFVDRFWISSPTLVAARIVDLFPEELWRHFWASTEVALYGLAIGMAAGVLVGVLLGLAVKVAAVLDPYIMMLYTLPRIALAPLFIMYLGIGTVSKVSLTFTMVVFIVILNTYEGVRSVDSELVDMLRTMRANRWQIIRWVVLPSIVPWLLATLRIGIGVALIGAIVSELISSSRGLGWYMSRSAGTFDVTGVFAGLIILAITAAIMNGFVSVIEKRFLAWR